MKTLKEVTGATAVVLVWTIMCLLISHKVDRPADPGTELEAVEAVEPVVSNQERALEEAIYYLLAERQEQEALYSAMVERIDQYADMVIDAIPDLPGLQLDQDEWDGAE